MSQVLKGHDDNDDDDDDDHDDDNNDDHEGEDIWQVLNSNSCLIMKIICPLLIKLKWIKLSSINGKQLWSCIKTIMAKRANNLPRQLCHHSTLPAATFPGKFYP